MKNIILKILVIFLKILYLPMKHLKTKNKITYMSREANKETLDFKCIRQEMEEKYPKYKNVVITKKIGNGLISKIGYCISVIKQMYHLATSKIIILDTYCITACVLSHKKDTKIIQIWHALGAIKKFGYQTLNTKAGSTESIAKTMCMHKNYDYVLAPSILTANIYQKAFNVEKEKIKYIGMPRVDYILKNNEEIKNQIYDTYPVLKQKQNIIYVPTFRKGEKVELDELVEKIDTQKYNLIIKLHPLDLKEYNYKQKDGVIYEQKFKTYDLLNIADKVITDYSSLSIEVALKNIPVYFYTYDIEKYEKETGLNFNFEEEPIGIYQTQDVDKLLELLDIDYNYEILNNFKNTYVSVNTNECTKQIVEFIVRLIRNEEIESIGVEPVKEEQNI